MILSLIVIVAVAGVAAFHYKQGLFSSTITAILSAVAAIVALGLNDFAATQLKGAIPELANAVLLVGVYALVFLILRVVFDAVIGPKVEVPLLADQIGGPLAGAIAGFFGAGIFVLAFQMLPFGPVILGYSRLDTNPTPTPVTVKGSSSAINTPLSSEKVDEVPRHKLIIPVDDMVAGLTSHMSSGGALAGAQSMAVVHPALVDELFLQRVGIQAGANRVAVNVNDGPQGVGLSNGLFALTGPIPMVDGEIKELATGTSRWSVPKVDPQLKIPAGSIALVARLLFTATPDPDGNIRISPGTVRLAAAGKNYYPIGAIDWVGGPILRLNRPDDFLVLAGGGAVDFVYLVPSEDLGGVNLKDAGAKVGADVVIVARRLGLIDLSGVTIQPGLPPAMGPSESTIIRKAGVHPEVKAAAPVAAGATPPSAGTGAVLEEIKAKYGAQLPLKIALVTHDAENGPVTFNGGNGGFRQNKLDALLVDPTSKIEELTKGTDLASEFWVGPDQKMVQVSAQVPAQPEMRWQWGAKIMQFELVTSGGNVKPRGVWAEIKQGDGSSGILARLNPDDAPIQVPKSEATPMSVVLIFLIPAANTPTELRFEGKPLAPINLTAEAAPAPAVAPAPAAPAGQ